MRAAIVQMPAPQAQLVDQPKARLAYTRKDGWVVVKHLKAGEWYARPGGKRVMEYEVLAWADLPAVPETAA